MLQSKKIAWTAAICWMAVIFVLSHQPASTSSGLSSGIAAMIIDAVYNILPGVDIPMEGFHLFIRKNAHFFAYFVLGILLLNAFRDNSRHTSKDLFVSFMAAVLFAASDEFHQLFIDGRSGELRDVLIDSSGAATGIFVYWTIISQLSGRRKEFTN